MPLDREKILQALETHANDIRALGVRRLALFGSCARGDQTETSDLDFLVEFERKTFDSYMDIKFLLEDLFGTSVDLVLSDGIKPRLRARILGEAVHAQGL